MPGMMKIGLSFVEGPCVWFWEIWGRFRYFVLGPL